MPFSIDSYLTNFFGNRFKGQKINVRPKESITITYARYSTTSLICFRTGLYLFSNGYLTAISKDNGISTSISDDYLTLTFENTTAEWLYGMIILADQILTITYA